MNIVNQKISELVTSIRNVNEQDKDGNSLLHLAAQFETSKVIKLLQNVPKKVSSAIGKGFSIVNLFVSIFKAAFDLVYHSNFRRVDWKNETEDVSIEERENEKLFNFLLNAGANIHLKNKLGETPLHCLARNTESSGAVLVNLATNLLARGADVNVTDVNGDTPIHFAARFGNEVLFKLLLKPEANINSKNNQGCTPVHCLVWSTISGVVSDLKTNLMSLGIQVNLENNSGDTALHLAAKYQNEKLFQLLLLLNADLNSTNADGRTILHLLVHVVNKVNADKTVSLAVELINRGVNVDPQDKKKQTPLFYGVRNGNTKITQFLLKNGAQVNTIDKDKSSPLLNLLNNKCSLKSLKLLLEYGADVNQRDKDGYSALTKILENKDQSYKLLELLLEYGADVNVLSQGVRYLKSNKAYRDVILEHIAKLQVLEVAVHPRLLDKICKIRASYDYLTKCKKELLKAKNEKLPNSWITYLNILTDDKYKLLKYAGNKRLIEHFQNIDLEDEFPIYGRIMHKRFSGGLKNRRSWNEAAVTFSNHLPVFSPTHLIIRNLLDYMSMIDLLKLLE